MSHSVNGDGASDAGEQDEVTALSTKLIRAINHQTTLDNALTGTRQELEAARAKIRQLETVTESQREMLAGDVWVRRRTIEGEKKALSGKVSEERRKREGVEKEKRRIELELENLTTALFEEANKMVVSVKEEAKRKEEALEKRNEILKAQVADTEGLLQSQQEQLAELKAVMEHMTDRDDTTNLTTPSSPGGSRFGHERIPSEGQLPASPEEPVSPAYPTSFSHLIQPVLRRDTAAFEDFRLLAKASKSSGTRTSSSSLSGINVANLGLGGPPGNTHSSTPSTSSLPAGLASASSSPQGHAPPAAGPLKDTKFFKRVLAEDIEPTLRLDAAPGLSWLARRGVLSAVTEGSLVVEPAPAGPIVPLAPHPQHYPCSLCGESKKDEEHLRTHRFRTSESESAQRYPLCGYCLGRVRSTCELLGFLRIVKDGHWRVGGGEEEDVRSGWEESVRLREQMFWARIGGGVVPAGSSIEDKPDESGAEKGGSEDRHDESPTPSPSPRPRSPQIRVQGPEARTQPRYAPMFGPTLMGI